MATNLPKKNRLSETDALQSMSDGLNKHAATIVHLLLGGVATTPAEIVSKLQAGIASGKLAQTTRATWQAAVDADRQTRTPLLAYVSLVRQALLAAFAGQVGVLADFGLTPRKKPVTSPEVKAAAALKAKATRAARGTRSKKQNAQITTQVAITPATATPVKSVPVTDGVTPAPTATATAPTISTSTTSVVTPSPSPAPATQTPPAPAAHS